MAKRKLWVIAYDVSNASRGRKVLNIITEYATMGQKSCYEVWLLDSEINEFQQKIKACLDNDEDKWAMFPIGAKPKTICLGIAIPPKDRSYEFIGW